jgi:hypothetical protein
MTWFKQKRSRSVIDYDAFIASLKLGEKECFGNLTHKKALKVNRHEKSI